MKKTLLQTVVVSAVLISSTAAIATSRLILNEWNCVGATKQLDDGAGSDSTFGTVTGNGGNWIELVVTEDNTDLANWHLEWANDDPNTGFVYFKDSPVWDGLKAGTIITIYEIEPGENDDPNNLGGFDPNTDVSYDPGNGDWWIHVALDDDRYVQHNGDPFKVDNDNWRMRIWNGDPNTPIPFNPDVTQDWVGESITGWLPYGSGINSREVGKLEENPTNGITISDNYDDGDNSTFGAPNTWGGGSQCFNDLRGITPACP